MDEIGSRRFAFILFVLSFIGTWVGWITHFSAVWFGNSLTWAGWLVSMGLLIFSCRPRGQVARSVKRTAPGDQILLFGTS